MTKSILKTNGEYGMRRPHESHWLSGSQKVQFLPLQSILRNSLLGGGILYLMIVVLERF